VTHSIEFSSDADAKKNIPKQVVMNARKKRMASKSPFIQSFRSDWRVQNRLESSG